MARLAKNASRPAPDRAMPPAHPAAGLFPLMDEPELAALAEDIAEHGQREAIVTLDGQILDGRNRWLACVRAGVEPRLADWDGAGGSPTAFVLSGNLHRRHLSPTQRAAIAAEAVALFAAEARARQAAAGGDRRSEAARSLRDELTLSDSRQAARSLRDELTLSDPRQDDSKRAVVQAARAVGAGVSATKTMAAVRKAAPEVFALAKEDKVTVTEAKRLTALPEAERTAAVSRAKAAGRSGRRGSSKGGGSRGGSGARKRLNPTARKLLDGTPAGADRAQLRQLARLPPATQKEVARRIARGDEPTVAAANEALIASVPGSNAYSRALTAALALHPVDQRRLCNELLRRLGATEPTGGAA